MHPAASLKILRRRGSGAIQQLQAGCLIATANQRFSFQETEFPTPFLGRATSPQAGVGE